MLFLRGEIRDTRKHADEPAGQIPSPRLVLSSEMALPPLPTAQRK